MMGELFQVSTYAALTLGNFDAAISVKDFLRHGDTGLGTYTGLNGEALFEHGVPYHAGANGCVTIMLPEDGVAFGAVAPFHEDVPEIELTCIDHIDSLKAALDSCVASNRNAFYLMKATGLFTSMHVRSCFPEKKTTVPCRRLLKASASFTLPIPMAA